MCGITGFYAPRHFQEFKRDLFGAASMLSHRGPDDEGVYFDEPSGVGLAHRRLSIIDLSDTGHQPMSSDDGQLVIVYNGEVYNYQSVRKVLEGKGYIFRSSSDTEVVLKAYQQWGPRSLDRLAGMFSMAIWDMEKKSLFLARDRLGIKPLYYYQGDGQFVFGSELKSLMAFRYFPRDLDIVAIPQFLHYQYIPAPYTVFKNTFKLMPGHYLQVDGQETVLQRYWEGSPSEQEIKGVENETELIDHMDSLFSEVIGSHLVSDVPLGALLSGGIDSSLVVSLMQKVNKTPVRTFSIGFEDEKYNEGPWAEKIARHLGTDHSQLVVTSKEALQVIPRLSSIYDEPFADSSAVPTCLVSCLTRSRVAVALSGDGGDEQFAGYVRYWMTESMWRRRHCIPEFLRSAIASGFQKIPHRSAASLYRHLGQYLPERFQVANFPDKWQKLIGQLTQSELVDLYRMTISIWPAEDIFILMGMQVKKGVFEACFDTNGKMPVLSRLMHVDQSTYLPDAMLTKVDRASMAAGLEIRVPLLDHRIVEFSSRLPHRLHYKDGQGKYLLRKLLSRYVPPQLFERPKMGFGVPLAEWLRKDLKSMVRDYLSPARLRKEGLFDPEVVHQKIQEHESGLCNHHHRIWALLMWEMWREQWLN